MWSAPDQNLLAWATVASLESSDFQLLGEHFEDGRYFSIYQGHHQVKQQMNVT